MNYSTFVVIHIWQTTTHFISNHFQTTSHSEFKTISIVLTNFHRAQLTKTGFELLIFFKSCPNTQSRITFLEARLRNKLPVVGLSKAHLPRKIYEWLFLVVTENNFYFIPQHFWNSL